MMVKYETCLCSAYCPSLDLYFGKWSSERGCCSCSLTTFQCWGQMLWNTFQTISRKDKYVVFYFLSTYLPPTLYSLSTLLLILASASFDIYIIFLKCHLQLQKMFFLFPDPHFKEKNHRRRIIRYNFTRMPYPLENPKEAQELDPISFAHIHHSIQVCRPFLSSLDQLMTVWFLFAWIVIFPICCMWQLCAARLCWLSMHT